MKLCQFLDRLYNPGDVEVFIVLDDLEFDSESVRSLINSPVWKGLSNLNVFGWNFSVSVVTGKPVVIITLEENKYECKND